MVNALAIASAFAVALVRTAPTQATVSLEHGVPSLVGLQAANGQVFTMNAAADTTPVTTANADCVLDVWQLDPTTPCDGTRAERRLTRHVNIAQSGTGKACDAIEKTEACPPVNCETSEWTKWSGCLASVTKVRTREIIRQPLYGGRECPFTTDVVQCCEDDCLVTRWSDWTCVNGVKTHTREKVRDKQKNGKECPDLTETGDSCAVCKYEDSFTYARDWLNRVMERSGIPNDGTCKERRRCTPREFFKAAVTDTDISGKFISQSSASESRASSDDWNTTEANNSMRAYIAINKNGNEFVRVYRGDGVGEVTFLGKIKWDAIPDDFNTPITFEGNECERGGNAATMPFDVKITVACGGADTKWDFDEKLNHIGTCKYTLAMKLPGPCFEPWKIPSIGQ